MWLLLWLNVTICFAYDRTLMLPLHARFDWLYRKKGLLICVDEVTVFDQINVKLRRANTIPKNIKISVEYNVFSYV